jgi:hypothetical protein
MDSREWKHEVTVVGGVLFGCVLAPVALLLVAAPLLGPQAQAINPGFWFNQALTYVSSVQAQRLAPVWGVLEEALDSARNRIDLPFLTLLSVMGVLDSGSQQRSFNRIVAVTVVVPTVLAIMISSSSASPSELIYLTWRGLYIIPLYLTGALGVESIIRRVNGSMSSWSRSRLAFAGTFTAYIFLSHLSYSLRALELLILVVRAS